MVSLRLTCQARLCRDGALSHLVPRGDVQSCLSPTGESQPHVLRMNPLPRATLRHPSDPWCVSPKVEQYSRPEVLFIGFNQDHACFAVATPCLPPLDAFRPPPLPAECRTSVHLTVPPSGTGGHHHGVPDLQLRPFQGGGRSCAVLTSGLRLS
jgi:hypothetical protein